MAIQAISGVNNNGYANISFSGKKDKSSSVSSAPNATSTLKAVPLAVLIAMSPLNSINASGQAQQPEHEDVILMEGEYKDGLQGNPYGYSPVCKVAFISNDGDNNDYEKMALTFTYDMTRVKTVKDKETDKTKQEYIKTHRLETVDLDTLVTCEVKYLTDNNEPEVHKFYSVAGPASYYTVLSNPKTGDVLKRSVSKDPKYRIEITEDFYNTLKEVMGDKVAYKDEKEVMDLRFLSK